MGVDLVYSTPKPFSWGRMAVLAEYVMKMELRGKQEELFVGSKAVETTPVKGSILMVARNLYVVDDFTVQPSKKKEPTLTVYVQPYHPELR